MFAAGPFLVLLGVFLHYVSDAQKFFTMQLRKGLIVDGLFRRTRNPNYLGEVLTYAGFVIVSWHWEAGVVLAAWFLYYLRNMRQKDKSLARYTEFAAYKQRTGILLPALHPRRSGVKNETEIPIAGLEQNYTVNQAGSRI
jgi:protein-S-isoprenylcysteine O-methyltransferase Ste14